MSMQSLLQARRRTAVLALASAGSSSRLAAMVLPRKAQAAAAEAIPTSRTRAFSSTSLRRSETLDATIPITPASQYSPSLYDSFLEKLEPLASAFHELPAALGLSHSSYAYALSILILTYALRTTVTLPATLWQRRRNDRLANEALPAWATLKKRLPEELARQCRKEGVSYEEYQRRLQVQLKAELKQLMKKHRCAPLASILIPSLAVHIPLFLLVTQVLRLSIASSTSPLAHEVLAWWTPPEALMKQFEEGAKVLAARGLEGEALQKLSYPMGPSLADTDRTMIGPIALGLLTLSNVELNQWLRKRTAGDAEAAKGKAPEGTVEDATLRVESSELEPLRAKVLGNTLRAASILFVAISSQAPSALVVYWLSSASYTLIQSSVFAVIDRRKAAAQALINPVQSEISASFDLSQEQRKAERRQRATRVQQARARAGWGGEVGSSTAVAASSDDAPKRAKVGVAARAAEAMGKTKPGLAQRAKDELERRNQAK